VHGTEGVLETGMVRTGEDQVRQAELLDPPEPLKIWMFNDPECQFARYSNETVNRVIDDFAL
jgi:hypothetical protein